MPLPCSSHSAFKSRCVVRSCGFTLVRLYRIAETLAGLPGTELLWYIWLQTNALVGGSSTLHRYPVDIIQTPIHTHVHWHKGEWIKGRVGGMDGEAHTVIAGMPAQQEGMGRMRWVGGSYNGGGCDDSRHHSLHIRPQSSSSLPANVISRGQQIVIHREQRSC